MTAIFKICGKDEWDAAEVAGIYHGSEDDERDGFIHFSTAAQLAGTLVRHFAGRADLLLIAVDADRLDGALRWEPSRGGTLFPHLYGPLPVADALWTRELLLDDSGQHILPDEVKP